MHTEWLNFLSDETQNASPFNTESSFLCPTEHLGLIEVKGEDSLSFLQNQFSNDIALIEDGTCQLNSYSNHKGRMYSIFYVIKHEDGYLLIAPKSQIAFLLQRLQMFVIMAKVTLTDVSENWAKLGVQSAEYSHQAFDNNAQVNSDNDSIHIRLNPNNEDRVLILCSFARANDLWSELKNQLQVVTSNTWQLAEINEGIPSLTPETSEAFVLQMSNLHLLEGVNFKKGCFPGQEIVARTRYLGKAKRRMYLASVESNKQPLPTEELCTIDSEVSDGTGKVVLSAQADDNHFDFLFVGNIKKTENDTLKLLNDSDAKVLIKKLPYSFEE